MVTDRPEKVVFIGAGNLASNLAPALKRQGFEPVQVYSRSEESASALAARIGCGFTTRTEDIVSDADLYVFAVRDDVLPRLLPCVPPNKGLWIHTAGSLDVHVLAPYSRRYGVIYPLQTFSKNRETDFSVIPVFIEGCNPEEEKVLAGIAGRISERVIPVSSETRRHIHLAAVFACNFTNYMYAAANQILSEHHLPFDILRPLIDETAAKVHRLDPVDAQTGPAVRYDEQVMNRQMELLTDPSLKTLYAEISRGIFMQSREKTTPPSHEQN